ncbi:MAG: DUF721 domain-containing protein [Gammaproteobacteria bacterium]|nr:DUF721 domain-containing protein [Gammaproteobacteria bacterium]
MPNKPKPITEMFSPTSNLGQLKHHISQIKQLEERLRKLLPFPLNEDYSWYVGNFRDRHLTLFTESPGQASKLRFQQRLFLEMIRSIQTDIDSLSIKVIYRGKEHKKAEKVTRKLSQEAAESISTSAEYINDSELRAALQRLSRHGMDGESK